MRLALLLLSIVPVLPFSSQGESPEEDALGVGDWWEETIDPGASGTTLRLRVDVLEPLTIVLDSWEADVRLSIETLEGAELARDDDGSLLPNALLHWTPTHRGLFQLRLRTDADRKVEAALATLRGTLDPEPPDLVEYRRGYWHIAFALGLEHDDESWSSRALNELVALEGHADEGGFLERWAPRFALFEELAPLLAEVDRFDSDAWRLLNGSGVNEKMDTVGRVAQAVDRLLHLPEATEDPVVAFQLFSLGFAAGWLYDDDTSLRAWQHALAYGEKILPPWNADLLWLRYELARVLSSRGRILEALEQEQLALVVLEQIYPPLAPDVLRVQHNLAVSRHDLGDLEGAIALLEHQLQLVENQEAPGALHLRPLYVNLNTFLREVGRLEESRAFGKRARELLQEGLDLLAPDLHVFKIQLATQHLGDGDVEGARELLEEALGGLVELVGPDNPLVQIVRHNLAEVLLVQGEAGLARKHAADAASALEALPGMDLGEVNDARGVLLRALAEIGDAEALEQTLHEFVRTERQWLVSRWRLPWHLVRQSIQGGGDRVALLSTLALPPNLRSVMDRERFALVETTRMLAAFDRGGRGLGASSQANDLERELRIAVQASTGAVLDSEEDEGVSKLAAATMRRDALEGRLNALAAKVAGPVPKLNAEHLARSLTPEEALLGWFSVESPDGSTDLYAHLLRSDGSLVVPDPIPQDEVERLVETYRSALGVSQEPGPPHREANGEEHWMQAGEALRRRVLDPILSAAGEVKRLHVALDGALHLVDLETLPLGPDHLVGDRVRIHVHPSFRALVQPDASPAGDPVLLTVHDVAYDGPGKDAVGLVASASAYRSGARGFRPLRRTGEEVSAVREAFHERWPQATGIRLAGRGATKAALFESASGAQFVHLATHGFFGIRALNELGMGPSSEGLNRLSRVLSPFALTGLALAGANQADRPGGRVPGVLSAEELLAMDLYRCELFVASACDTRAGIRQAGIGVQSLHAAAHAAGARRTLTSLWAVEDRRTAETMRRFYRRMWADGQSAADALWSVKREDWTRRVSPRHWACWVLSGDPD